MPEGPELHITSLFINRICRDLIFSGKVARNPIHKCADIDWDEPAYKIYSESRGKELMLHLQTVDQVQDQSSQKQKKLIGCKPTTPGKCSSILFTFGMSGKFEWTNASQLLKHSHLTFFAKTLGGDEKNAMALSFVDYRRFGKWHQNAEWSKDRGPCTIQEFDAFVNHVADKLDHNAFKRPICETMLDQRFFSGIGNYLRAEILFRCKVAPFERARTVLNGSDNEELSSGSNGLQSKSKKMTGKSKKIKEEETKSGNVKSECCETWPSLVKSEPPQAGHIKEETKEIKLEENGTNGIEGKVMWSKFSSKGQEILQLCHSVPLEVVKLGSTKYSLSDMYKDADDESQSFDDWLQCYYKDGMKNLADHNSRTIWFTGPAGPLVPKEQKSRGKKSTKKASKDPGLSSKQKNKIQTETKSNNTSKPTKGHLTRKHLEILENSSRKGKSDKLKVKQRKDSKRSVRNGHEALLKSGSKRKRQVEVEISTAKSVAAKKKKTDCNDRSKEHRRATRSSVRLCSH